MIPSKSGKWIDTDDLGLQFIFDFRNPIVITHGDVDGLCAAALIIKEFELNGIQVPVFITQPFSLNIMLQKIKKSDMKGNLIILDLALTKESVKEIPKGSVVIDHHPATLDFMNTLDDVGVHYLVDIEVSASELVRKLVTNSKWADYTARLGGGGDWTIEDRDMGKEAMMLSAAMSLNPKDDEFRTHVIAELLSGKKVYKMREVMKNADKAFDLLDNTKKSGSTLYDGNNFLVVFYERGFGRVSALASKLAAATKKTSSSASITVSPFGIIGFPCLKIAATRA